MLPNFAFLIFLVKIIQVETKSMFAELKPRAEILLSSLSKMPLLFEPGHVGSELALDDAWAKKFYVTESTVTF